MLKENGLKRFIIVSLMLLFSFSLISCQDVPLTTSQLGTPDSVGSFASYDALQTYLSSYYTSKDGDYLYRGGLFTNESMFSDGVDAMAPTSTDSTTSDSVGQDEQVTYSQTNNQVDGVSESDRILTDGYHIYVSSNSHFYIINAETLEIEYTYNYENGYVYGMYLYNNYLVLLSSEYIYTQDQNSYTTESGAVYYYYTYNYGTRVNVFDVTDPTDTSVYKTLFFESSNIVNTRMIDGTLYLVMDNYKIYYGYKEDDFVPTYRDSAVSDGLLQVQAENIYYMPNDVDSIGYLLLVSLQVDNTEGANVKAYLGSSYQIYMSLDNLFTIIYRYSYDEVTRAYSQDTYILRFEITNNELVFQALAHVSGMPLNQFSMDEYDGVFRIATTEYSWDGSTNSVENRLFLLDSTTFNTMAPLGLLEDLGKPGERIYAVRYSGDTAYVVTFVNTDPLYKLDLSDPENPEIIGELYEEGVSDYLHIINDNLMLGIGRQAEVNEWGNTAFTGVKVALYDTSGDDPVALETYLVEGEYSWTPVTYDHKAFVSYQPTGADYMYVVIPVSEYMTIQDDEVVPYYYYTYTQSAYVFKVYFSGDLEFVTKLSHYNEDPEAPWYSYFDTIDRTVMIGDRIYTVSYSKVQMYDMNDNFALLGSVTLEADYYWYAYGYDIATTD